MDSYFKIETALRYETHGYWMYSMTLDVEAGTCFMMPSQNAKYKDGRKLFDLPLEQLINRPCCILNIPKQEGGLVDVADVETAFSKADFREGDAVLLRTGWGDNERYFSMGDDYVIKTPHYVREGARRLAEIMASKHSDLFLTDTALLGYPAKHFIPEWAMRNPRPKSLPSSEAQEYLKGYTRERMKEDWNTFDAFPEKGITACKCLVNCGQIRGNRTKLIIVPLRLRDAPSSTCRIVAVED